VLTGFSPGLDQAFAVPTYMREIVELRLRGQL